MLPSKTKKSVSPVAQVALPEAPGSANVFVNVGGFRGQVTIRSYATEADIDDLIENIATLVEGLTERGVTADGGGASPVTGSANGGYASDQTFLAYELEAEFHKGTWYWKVSSDPDNKYPRHEYPTTIFDEALEEFGLDADTLDPEVVYPLYHPEDGRRIKATYARGVDVGKKSEHPYKITKLEYVDEVDERFEDEEAE